MMPRTRTPPPVSSTPKQPAPPGAGIDRATADRPTAYALDVVSGAILAGPHVRDAARRHLTDLNTGPKRGLLWSADAANRAIAFFETVLRFPDGDRAGEPFILESWQAFVVGSLFGWLRQEDGLRRFRTAYIETGKGSGKSPIGAGIGLYLLTADKQKGAECYCAAVTRDQAHIAFRDAVRMVDASAPLSSILIKSGTRVVFNLAVRSGGKIGSAGSFFRPISSEGRALDGKRVHFALLDEVHEHPSPVVVEKITAGIKAMRQPLICEITNSGYDRHTICWQHHEYSAKVCAGSIEDDEWFAYVCALDLDDKPLQDESCWIKANPSLGVTIRHDYLRKQVREARGMPAKESIVLRLNFCRWTDAANPWIDGDLWRKCERAFVTEGMEETPAFGGLDLSGKNDLTSLGLIWRLDDGRLRGKVWYWMPGDKVEEHERRDSVPYSAWVRDGLIFAPPGRAIKYSHVASTIGDLIGQFNIQSIAFDAYHIEFLQTELDALGIDVPLISHGQGFRQNKTSDLWMPRSIELLEGAIFEQRIDIEPNPVLAWNSASAVLDTDEKESRIFKKRKSTGRIDGLVALTMATGNALATDDDGDMDDFIDNMIMVGVD
jgi:phage terminase large subunit-like protein